MTNCKSPFWYFCIIGRRVLEFLNLLRPWPLCTLISILFWCQTTYENIIHICNAEKQPFQMIWHIIAPHQSNGNQSRKNTILYAFLQNNCHLHNFLMKIEKNLEHIEFSLFYKDWSSEIRIVKPFTVNELQPF